MRKQKVIFPPWTPFLSLQAASIQMSQEISNSTTRFGFILDYENNRILRSFGTSLLGYDDNAFNFENYKALQVNDLLRLIDEVFSRIGLEMVQKGEGIIVDSSFNVKVLVNTLPNQNGTRGAFIMNRKTYVRKLRDGDRIFDALVIYYEKKYPFAGWLEPYRPVFRDPDENLLSESTNELKVSACDEILSHDNFPVKGDHIDICEYVLDGKPDQYIAQAMGLTIKEIRYIKKYHIVRKFRPYLSQHRDCKEIVLFLHACGLW